MQRNEQTGSDADGREEKKEVSGSGKKLGSVLSFVDVTGDGNLDSRDYVVLATLLAFIIALIVAVVSVFGALLFGEYPVSKSLTWHVMTLHKALGNLLSALLVLVLLPGTKAKQYVPQDLPGPMRLMFQFLDFDGNGTLTKMDVATNLVVLPYSLALISSLGLCVLSQDGDRHTLLITLGAGMARLCTTVLIKGYFANDSSDSDKEKNDGAPAKQKGPWWDIDSDGVVSPLDVFCYVIVVLFFLIECVNFVNCALWLNTSMLLAQLNGLHFICLTIMTFLVDGTGHSASFVTIIMGMSVLYVLLLFAFLFRLATGDETPLEKQGMVVQLVDGMAISGLYLVAASFMKKN